MESVSLGWVPGRAVYLVSLSTAWQAGDTGPAFFLRSLASPPSSFQSSMAILPIVLGLFHCTKCRRAGSEKSPLITYLGYY